MSDPIYMILIKNELFQFGKSKLPRQKHCESYISKMIAITKSEDPMLLVSKRTVSPRSPQL